MRPVSLKDDACQVESDVYQLLIDRFRAARLPPVKAERGQYRAVGAGHGDGPTSPQPLAQQQRPPLRGEPLVGRHVRGVDDLAAVQGLAAGADVWRADGQPFQPPQAGSAKARPDSQPDVPPLLVGQQQRTDQVGFLRLDHLAHRRQHVRQRGVRGNHLQHPLLAGKQGLAPLVLGDVAADAEDADDAVAAVAQRRPQGKERPRLAGNRDRLLDLDWRSTGDHRLVVLPYRGRHVRRVQLLARHPHQLRRGGAEQGCASCVRQQYAAIQILHKDHIGRPLQHPVQQRRPLGQRLLDPLALGHVHRAADHPDHPAVVAPLQQPPVFDVQPTAVPVPQPVLAPERVARQRHELLLDDSQVVGVDLRPPPCGCWRNLGGVVTQDLVQPALTLYVAGLDVPFVDDAVHGVGSKAEALLASPQPLVRRLLLGHVLHQADDAGQMAFALALGMRRHPADRAVRLRHAVLMPKRHSGLDCQAQRRLDACAVIGMDARQRPFVVQLRSGRQAVQFKRPVRRAELPGRQVDLPASRMGRRHRHVQLL